MDDLTNKTVIVLTRYNENIDWLRYIINFVDHIFIYNKGENENFFKIFNLNDNIHKITIQRLPNVGRIDHTLVYFILEHWDNLPEKIVNLPGSVMMCKSKGYYLSAITKKLKTVKEKYKGFYSPRFHIVSSNYNYTINDYKAEGFCNKNDNPFIKSEYPDLQTWKKSIIDNIDIKYVAMRGMFVVCRDNIKHIDKSIYENLRASLSIGDNIENGHFAERIWAHLFKQFV